MRRIQNDYESIGSVARTFQLSCGERSATGRRTSSTDPKRPPSPICKRANSRRTFSRPSGWPARFSGCSSTGPSRLWTRAGRKDWRKGRNSLRRVNVYKTVCCDEFIWKQK